MIMGTKEDITKIYRDCIEDFVDDFCDGRLLPAGSKGIEDVKIMLIQALKVIGCEVEVEE